MFGRVTAKEYFLTLVSILLLTDLVILLNIPFLRQVFGFICFTFIPGVLTLHIIRLNKIEFTKKFVLSVGLSVAFLMFGGLLVNSFYPFTLNPLSLFPILITFNIILILLIFIAYKRNEDEFDMEDVFNFNIDLKDKSTSLLIFPILFPFMAVFGTYLMNVQNNNIILLVMLLLIITYVILVTLLYKKIPNQTYPIAILMISISLLLMLPLRSSHIDFADINIEYFFFQQTILNQHWDVSKFYHNYNACLSVGILPAIYQTLLNINGEYVYKIAYNLIFSVTPLCLYVLFRRYIGELYAFLSSFLFMSQFRYINMMYMLPRVEIALFFFALAMMVFFDNEIDKLTKKTLFLILLFAVIVSHYSTTYIFSIVLFLSWLVAEILRKRANVGKNTTLNMIVLFFALIFVWYSQVTEAPFTAGIKFFEQTFTNLGNFFILESRSPGLKVLYGGGLLMILLPYLSVGISIEKLYLQALVLLAPMFIIGSKFVSKRLHAQNTSLIILIILIPQFICSTYLVYQIWGVPYSYAFNSNGYEYDLRYVHDQEVVAAQWLGNSDNPNLPIYTDCYGFKRLIGHGCGDRWRNAFRYDLKSVFAEDKPIAKGYSYLRYQNVVDGIFIPVQSGIPFHQDEHNTSEYSIFLKDKLYSNGGAEIYYWNGRK